MKRKKQDSKTGKGLRHFSMKVISRDENVFYIEIFFYSIKKGLRKSSQ